MIFRICVNPRDILKAVEGGDLAAYLNNQPSLEYAGSGSFGHHTNVTKLLSEKVKGMQNIYAVNSVDVHKIIFGNGETLANGALVRLYRPMWSADGTRYSKSLGYARLYDVSDGSGSLMPITAGARKIMSEDVAVHTSDKRNTLKVEASYMKRMWGFNIGYSYMCSTNRYGWSWRYLLELGYAGAGQKDNPESSMLPYHSINSFMINTGMGFSCTFGGFIEVMPFATLGYAYVHTVEPNTYGLPLNGNYLRIPLGVSLGLDLGYPVQLLFTAGYSPKIGFNFKNVESPFENNDKLNEYMKERGTAIDGLFIKLGLQFNI